MPLITSINDTNWPTSGTPTAGNSGFNSLTSGGTLIYEVDENGEKYITTTTANASLLVRIDATSAVFASSETRYHCELVVMAEFTGQSGANTIGSPSGFAIDFDTGGGGVRATMTFAAANNVYNAGIYPSFSGFNGVSASYGLSGQFKEPIPVNKKFAYQFFADKAGDGSVGISGLCFNGVRAGRWTATSPANWSTSVIYSMPATPGVRWRVYATAARPARSWSGTDHEFTPLYSDYSLSSDGLSKAWPHIAPDGLHGNLWTYSGALSLTEYEASGINPNRRRLVGGSGGVTATSKLDIGTLEYNNYGDSAIISTFYVPSSGTASFAIQNAANTSNVFKFQIASGQLQDASGTQMRASDGTAVSIATDKRYGVVVNLSRSGEICWTILNMTDDPDGRLVYSNIVSGGWTVAALGKIVLTASQNSEWDRVDICKWWTNAICDSLSVAYTATVSPRIATTANNLGYGFPHSDAIAMPGGAYGCDWYGWPKETLMICSGRSGRKRSEWGTQSRDYMIHTRAMRLLVLDGGCFNDINQGATATDMMSYVQADLSFCNRNNCELVLMPSFTRPYGLTFSLTTAKTVERRKFNALQEAFVQSNSSNPRLYYCDHFRGYRETMISTDGVHPSSGTDANCRAIASTLMTAAQRFRNGAPVRAKSSQWIRR